MAHDPRHLTDTYKEGFCCVCGISGVNQFYGIRESYIDYCGNFQTLTEMLNDLLNVSQPDENEMEICYDCKEKLVRFFHFKRKAHEVQEQLKRSKKKTSKKVQNNHNDTVFYQEDQINEKKSFKILSAVSLIDEEVAIKEEKEEEPSIVYTGYSSDYSMPESNEADTRQLSAPPPKRYNSWNRSKHDKGDKPLSKAALKMRLYRERLKLPENRDRFLQHQRQQREYNRRHYQRKQGMGEHSKSHRQNQSNYEDDEDYDEDLFVTP